MAKHTVSELEGALLDGAVALAEGMQLGPDWNQEAEVLVGPGTGKYPYRKYRPSRSWADGGPIIERYAIELRHELYEGPDPENPTCEEWYWDAYATGCDDDGHGYHEKLLVAAMRAFVAAKFGPEVELP